MKFGEYLNLMRKQRGLSQFNLAQILGVSTVYICDIEKGRRYPPDLKKLQMLTELLKLSEEEKACLYELAGDARQSPSPDILKYLTENPAAQRAIRRIIGQQVEYDWDSVLKER